jgi:hypothetical protein
VILGGHPHNGSETLLVGPLRKHLTFISGSIDSGDLHDIRHAKRPQLANLRCSFILIASLNGTPSAPLGTAPQPASRRHHGRERSAAMASSRSARAAKAVIAFSVLDLSASSSARR